MKAWLKRPADRVVFAGVVVAAFLLPAAAFAAQDASVKPEAVVIGFNPGGDPAQIKPLALELAGDLQTALSIPVNIYISKNYEDLVDAMKDRKIDFAFFTAKTFVDAETKAGAKVLLKKVWTQPFYHAALIGHAGGKLPRGPVTRLKDIKGKKIAFVDRDSASGYLYPMVFLRKNGFAEKDFSEILWTGHHAASVEKLANGDADVIATFADDEKARTGAWTKFHPQGKLAVKVLWVSEPIPNDPFAVRQEFYNRYPMVTHSLMMALIDVFEKKRDRFAGLLGTKELVPATSRQYDPVREMVKAFEGEKK